MKTFLCRFPLFVIFMGFFLCLNSACRMLWSPPYKPSSAYSYQATPITITSSIQLKELMRKRGIELTDIDIGFIENRMYQNYWKGRQSGSPNFYIIDFTGKYEYTFPKDIWFSMGYAFISGGVKYLVKRSASEIIIVRDSTTEKRFTPK